MNEQSYQKATPIIQEIDKFKRMIQEVKATSSNTLKINLSNFQLNGFDIIGMDKIRQSILDVLNENLERKIKQLEKIE